MKRKFNIYVIALLCIAMTGCNDTLVELVPENNQQTSQEYHSIPLEDALAQLNDFLVALEKPTRSGDVRRIGNVEVLRSKNLATRSGSSNLNNADSLIYIVNFEDNQGFAYLAADDRISAPVIYVADSGNASTNGFGEPLIIGGEQRTIYLDYPINGPGTFYDEDVSPNELFMNPNTFSLYNEEEDEYLVGDFYLNGENEYNDMLSQVNNFTLNYVDNELGNNESIYQEIEHEDTPNPSEPALVVKTTVVTDTIINVYNLLSNQYHWSQSFPFNKYCPEVTHWKTRDKKTASAGCVSLAIAKIMAYHKYPEVLKVNYYTIYWNALNNNLESSFGETSAGYLTKSIRDNNISLYFYNGTFSFPRFAANYLRDRGYSNVRYIDYNATDVKNMLDNNCPIFICSVPSGGIVEQLSYSHAWNIDGYLLEYNTYTKKYYKNNVLINTIIDTEEIFMVHCDWGWEGAFNGYFTSDVFDLGDNDVYYDEKAHAGLSDKNYKWYKKIITYEKPN